MNKVILSGRHPQFAAALRERGYQVILTEPVEDFISYERDHADMQCLIMDDTAFVLSCCDNLAEALSEEYRVVRCGGSIAAKYPANVALNALVIGNYLISRTDSTDETIREYGALRGHQPIGVRQGYTKCACAVAGDHAIITADRGIYHSLKEYKVDILLIEEGRVRLDGANCGFIGGASGYDPERRILYFSGNIKEHPDAERIKTFCREHQTETVSLTVDVLTDIGGMIFC